MASSAVTSKLGQLEATASTQQRTEEYDGVLQSIISEPANQAENLVAYAQSITSDNIGVINSRPLLSSFVERFRDIADNDVKIEAGYVY